MSALLIGGILSIPGPRLDDSSSSLSASATFEKSSIKSKFSIVHYNSQSINNKVDLTDSELRNFDAICPTETWLDRCTSDETMKINGFNLCRCDRVDDNCGGICVCIYQSLFSCRNRDLTSNFHSLNVFRLISLCIVGNNCSAHL